MTHPRSHNDELHDLDSPEVTITMPAVTTRKASVFRAVPEDWAAVQTLARQFAREMNYDMTMGEFSDDSEVWLVQPEGIPRGSYSLACGAAEVEMTAAGGRVLWMWIHPNQRAGVDREGRAKILWDRLLEEYVHLTLEPPVSCAMQKFALKHGFGGAGPGERMTECARG